jgi:hypothetical protein
MNANELRQLRDAGHLISATVDVAVRELAKAHHAIARWPFTWLARVPGAAVPARAVEGVQYAVTATVYGSVRTVNRLGGMAATKALDRLADRAAAREH